MSIQLSIEELFQQLPVWGFGYLLTGSDSGRPHLIALRPSATGGVLRFDAGGGRACTNASTRPQVTVLFPPHPAAGGFSLVVDGDATVDGDAIDVRPTRALLHRPAP